MKSSRVGLSEYTARRLAELRARRAEADDTGGFITSVSSTSTSSSDTSTSPTTSASNALSLAASSSCTAGVSLTESSSHQNSVELSSSLVNGSQVRGNGSTGLSETIQRPDSDTSSSSHLTLVESANTSVAASAAAALPSSSSSQSTPSAESSSLPCPTLPETKLTREQPSESTQIYTKPDGIRSTGSFKSSSLFNNSSSPLVNRGGPSIKPAVGLPATSYSTASGGCDGHLFNSSSASAAKKPEVQIGFSNLPEQLHRKAVKKGFDFTVMVVGESGLGKSTLISNLFCKYDLYRDRKTPELSVDKTVELEKRYLEIEDHGIKLRLTVVDTPGFSDAIDSSHCWKSIAEYIEEQFEKYFSDETGLNRHNIKDTRVHCCLYFISPYGRGLRPVDIQLMHYLQNIVNIVPVIGKADTLTSAETKHLKTQILSEIKKYNIRTYQLPPCEEDEDEEYRARDKEMKDAWPFAVIGANAMVEVNGRRVRGRVYPWGIVEADNPTHSDFLKLQQFIISTHLHDLKEVTCDVHYENFRINRIRQQQNSPSVAAPSAEVITPLDDAEKLLQQKEEEIRRMQQMMREMQRQLTSSASTTQRVQYQSDARYINGPS
jgi:septin family protein